MYPVPGLLHAPNGRLGAENLVAGLNEVQHLEVLTLYGQPEGVARQTVRCMQQIQSCEHDVVSRLEKGYMG